MSVSPQLPEPDESYDVVRLPVHWGGLSLLFFCVVVAAHLSGRILPIPLTRLTQLTMVLPPIGLICGLLGLKFGDARRAAKLGTLLNGAILLIIFILLPLVFILLRRLS